MAIDGHGSQGMDGVSRAGAVAQRDKPAAAAGNARNISERRSSAGGKDISELDSFADQIKTAVISGVALIFVLAGVASILVTRRTVGRIESINATSRAIMLSGLDKRIPLRGTNDEWDRVAENLNLSRCLDHHDLANSKGQAGAADVWIRCRCHALYEWLGREEPHLRFSDALGFGCRRTAIGLGCRRSMVATDGQAAHTACSSRGGVLVSTRAGDQSARLALHPSGAPIRQWRHQSADCAQRRFLFPL